MQSDTKLNFADFLNPDGAEFPYCCKSGFWMTYNTRLRDPARPVDKTPSDSPGALLKKELARAKKEKQRSE